MPEYDDPRMLAPQCHSLSPVVSIHENNWFALKNRGGYFVVEYHRPQVVVLPILDNHSIVMVRVNRPVIADTPLELPAGGAKQNESPLQAAARELGEETGIEIKETDRFTLLSSIAISPNRYPVLPWIYELHVTQHEFDCRGEHDKDIAGVECFTFKEVQQLIVRGKIYVSLPIAVICRFFFRA